MSYELFLTKTMKNALNRIDLCFVVDTTGSMSPFLAAARVALVRTLEALNAKSQLDLQVGLVEYRDHPPQEHSFVTKHTALTNDLSKIQKSIDKLSASGGGDAPEAVFDGVYEAALLTEWREHSARFALLVGDAPPHGYFVRSRRGSNENSGENSASERACTCGLSLAQTSAAAEENRVVVQTLPISTDDSTRNAFTEIANMTGGVCAASNNADSVVTHIENLLTQEFSNLPLDLSVLETIQNSNGFDVETISQTLETTRWQVAKSLARLGKRGFLGK